MKSIANMLFWRILDIFKGKKQIFESLQIVQIKDNNDPKFVEDLLLLKYFALKKSQYHFHRASEQLMEHFLQFLHHELNKFFALEIIIKIFNYNQEQTWRQKDGVSLY